LECGRFAGFILFQVPDVGHGYEEGIPLYLSTTPLSDPVLLIIAELLKDRNPLCSPPQPRSAMGSPGSHSQSLHIVWHTLARDLVTADARRPLEKSVAGRQLVSHRIPPRRPPASALHPPQCHTHRRCRTTPSLPPTASRPTAVYKLNSTPESALLPPCALRLSSNSRAFDT
jgi:hypothetical protein